MTGCSIEDLYTTIALIYGRSYADILIKAYYSDNAEDGILSGNVARAAVPAVKAPPDLRLEFRAKYDAPIDTIYFPNQAYGPFTTGVTVAFSSTTGLLSGTSAAFLNILETGSTSGFNVNLEAVYDAPNHGFDCNIGEYSIENTVISPTTVFANTSQVDLQMVQTGTALNFLARPTPTGSGTGGWTTIYTVYNTIFNPISTYAYSPGIGFLNTNKGGAFYFNRIYLVGAAVGGAAEAPIYADAQTVVNSIHSAETDWQMAPPDLTDATTALNAAVAANNDAETLLTSATTNKTLQAPQYAKSESSSLRADGKTLSKIVIKSATLKASQIKGETGSLNAIAGSEEAIMLELLGVKSQNLNGAPANIFLLQPPQ